MAQYPTLTAPSQSGLFTNVFAGYDHNDEIADGSFFDMENLTGSAYPLLAPRAKRGVVQRLTHPQGLLAKDALAWVDGAELFYNGYKVDGVQLSTAEADCPKRLVSMGAYLCIWPDKVFVNTANLSEHGSMGARFTTGEGLTVRYAMCRMDGTEYAPSEMTQSSAEPESPVNGALWLDTSGDKHVLKQWASATAQWVQVATCYVRISSTGIGKQFGVYDGVRLSGCTTGKTPVSTAEKTAEEQVQALNGDVIVYAQGDDYLVTVGFLDLAFETTAQVTVERRIPDCDFICESENRLWGCRYGLTEGKPVNEIYCCKLGDFKNWYCYMGLSTDSYAVSVGTDGRWTGAATIGGHPVFFKENCLHKLSGSYPAAYQVITTLCRGVEQGSEGSLTLVGETLYYKARSGVMAYTGSLPVSVSSQLGTAVYHHAVGGAFGDLLYLSMQGTDGAWSLFVYDTAKGLWHREDATQVLAFAARGDELYFIDAGTGALMAERGTEGESEGRIRWSATTGVFGYSYEAQKYLSRFNLRMYLEDGSTCRLEIEYDSDGVWHEEGEITGHGTQSFCVPVIPRRCDHCRLRLSGRGGMKLFSIGRVLEVGSDG